MSVLLTKENTTIVRDLIDVINGEYNLLIIYQLIFNLSW